MITIHFVDGTVKHETIYFMSGNVVYLGDGDERINLLSEEVTGYTVATTTKEDMWETIALILA